MYIKRTVEETIKKMEHSFQCLAVYGPRQVGKSTMVHAIFADRFRHVSLDDADERALAIENPRLFLEGHPWPLIIDEVQRAPGLFDEIKRRIDAQRLLWLKNGQKRELMYVLTGSSRFELQEGISDSLAGRCGIVELFSFSQAEALQEQGSPFFPDIPLLMKRERELSANYRTRREIFADIFRGGMPDIVTGESERNAYFHSYVNTYIEKDIRRLISADREAEFRKFMSLLALRTGQELKYEDLSAAAGIDVRTCKRWLSILESSGIIFLLQPYMANASKRIIKAPKLYFSDTGLCSFLCRWQDAEMLEDGAMGGAFFETFVVSELIKNLSAYQLEPKDSLYYYRDIDQKEVDVLYTDGHRLYPIEIKKGLSPKLKKGNFSVLEKYKQEIGTGLLIDCCESIRPISDTLYSYPAHLLGR